MTQSHGVTDQWGEILASQPLSDPKARVGSWGRDRERKVKGKIESTLELSSWGPCTMTIGDFEEAGGASPCASGNGGLIHISKGGCKSRDRGEVQTQATLLKQSWTRRRAWLWER